MNLVCLFVILHFTELKLKKLTNYRNEKKKKIIKSREIKINLKKEAAQIIKKKKKTFQVYINIPKRNYHFKNAKKVKKKVGEAQ